MTTKIVKAVLIVIGDEILSGKTLDTNTQTIAKALNSVGIQLAETRTIADDKATIIKTVRELKDNYRYVFTTGGIGPTHDDITAESIAEAVEQPLITDDSSYTVLNAYYEQQQLPFTAARQKMATMPEGSEPIANAVTIAPGFRYDNIYVMAGVPKIMAAMLETILPKLDGGVSILSHGIATNVGESLLAEQLAELQQKYADVSIGSYPSFASDKSSSTTKVTIVMRHHDGKLLEEVASHVRDIITTAGGELISDQLLS